MPSFAACVPSSVAPSHVCQISHTLDAELEQLLPLAICEHAQSLHQFVSADRPPLEGFENSNRGNKSSNFQPRVCLTSSPTSPPNTASCKAARRATDFITDALGLNSATKSTWSSQCGCDRHFSHFWIGFPRRLRLGVLAHRQPHVCRWR